VVVRVRQVDVGRAVDWAYACEHGAGLPDGAGLCSISETVLGRGVMGGDEMRGERRGEKRREKERKGG
jgi:hypothetical protein